jgi:uncharacterized protein (TIGR02145 family)
MKQKLIFFIFLMCAVNLSAQVTIGALEEPHNAAILDLSKVSSQKLGLLLPTVELVKLDLFNPLPGNSDQQLDAKGMVVYNKKTNFVENLYPGIHVWDGVKWGRLGCIPATITEYIPGKIVSTTVGFPVTLGISAADSPGLTYLWHEAPGNDYTGGTPVNGATGASYSFLASTDAYYYCVVTSSCNASTDTSDVFTVNVVNPATLDPGSGRLSGRTAFDVAMVNNNNTCGALSKRPNIDGVYADFSDEATNTRTYTFTPSGSVNNVRFAYVESVPGIVTGLSPNKDYSGNGITTTCTATLYYDTELNGRVSGKTREDAFKVDIYAIYESGGQDYSVKLTAEIQDCAFAGAYTTTGAWLEFMPYNLGANPDYATLEAQMAYSSPTGSGVTNSVIYGDLYQWGRRTDGHQKRNSGTTKTLAISNTPGNVGFITGSSDWRSGGGNNERWTDATKADNDPCPPGYKVPTIAQWRSIFNGGTGNPTYATINTANTHNSWSWYSGGGTNGAYSGGRLFLPAAGHRYYSVGSLRYAGTEGYYWGSSVSGASAYSLYPDSSVVSLGYYNFPRAYGFSLRCVAE